MADSDKWSGALSLLGCFLVMTAVAANDDRASSRKGEAVVAGSSPEVETPRSWDVFLSNGQYGGRMGQLPANVKVQRYTIDESGRQQKVDAARLRATTTEIYSNTNDREPIGGAVSGVVWHRDDGRIADDMRTQAVTPCELAYVQVDVHGGNLSPDADPEPYDVMLEIWTGCPNGGGTPISGTQPTFTDLLDNEVSVLLIPVPPGTVPPSTTDARLPAGL